MAPKHKAAQGPAGVQFSLIITPMLDMSFQILAFFIMTYHPSALEAHIPGSLVPDNPAVHSKEKRDPLPADAPEPILDLPELQDAITIQVKAINKGNDKGNPEQIFLKTNLDIDRHLIADVGQVGFEKSLSILSAELKGMKGANKANIKIAADGDLRQQYVMDIYDTAKRAGFDKIHFVPPSALNTKLNVRP
ncbi:MAG TPA: biopolymer transporter ExbD [Gemmataceae bacterium]|nr:biopolymer transporter ExbD [Gemmataceae bacterium]